MITRLSLEIPDLVDPAVGIYEPKAIKFVKSIYDDNNVLLVSVEIKSIDEIAELASLEDLSDYINQAKTFYKNQVDIILSSLALDSPVSPSFGNALGTIINRNMYEFIYLREKLES